MKSFDDLTERGRLRRLHGLALEALREYDIEVGRCSYVARAFNTVFRIDATDGAVYALRMSPALRIHADGCEIAEAAWIDALRRDVKFPTPAVIKTRAGSAVVTAAGAGVPEARTGVLFDWVRGRRLREHMSADRVGRTGELTAVLHDYAIGYASSVPSGVIVADRVLSFVAPPRLDELRAAYGSVLVDAVERAQDLLDALWRDPPHRPHLLHGDVQPGNVMVHGGKVTLIDFQDLIWGFEIQDIVFALLALEHFGDAVSAAFRRGYEAVRPWPAASPETIGALRAARHLNILNFGLSVRGPDLDRFVDRHAAPVVEWMDSGAIRPRP